MPTRLASRLAAALASFSLWLFLLFAGVYGGGVVHLLLIAAGLLFPWKLVRSDS